MMRRPFFLFFLLLLLLGGFSVANLFVLYPEDEKEYLSLEKLKQEQKESTPKKLTQQRKSVTKELFLPKETERMEVKIISDSSTLYLQKQGKKWRLKEKLEKLTFYSQDKLYQKEDKSWFQKGKKIEAPGGWYNFSDQSFTAERVNLTFFELPGKTLPEIVEETDSFSGSASHVFLSWKTKLPFFSATYLKANIVP